MSKLKIETGSSPAEERFSITVTEKGPFLVYGLSLIHISEPTRRS